MVLISRFRVMVVDCLNVEPNDQDHAGGECDSASDSAGDEDAIVRSAHASANGNVQLPIRCYPSSATGDDSPAGDPAMSPVCAARVPPSPPGACVEHARGRGM